MNDCGHPRIQVNHGIKGINDITHAMYILELLDKQGVLELG